MELKDFLEKFLPDYEQKYKNSWEFYKKDVGIPNLSYNEFIVGFQNEYFTKALQNFADQICEKQRENCAETIYNYSKYAKIKVLNSKQPKINEL